MDQSISEVHFSKEKEKGISKTKTILNASPCMHHCTVSPNLLLIYKNAVTPIPPTNIAATDTILAIESCDIPLMP